MIIKLMREGGAGMGLKKIHIEFQPENLKERGNLGDQVMDETI
jgi:hypothetical protein